MLQQATAFDQIAGGRAKASAATAGHRRETAKFKASTEGTQIPRFTADQMRQANALDASPSNQGSQYTEGEAREK